MDTVICCVILSCGALLAVTLAVFSTLGKQRTTTLGDNIVKAILQGNLQSACADFLWFATDEGKIRIEQKARNITVCPKSIADYYNITRELTKADRANIWANAQIAKQQFDAQAVVRQKAYEDRRQKFITGLREGRSELENLIDKSIVSRRNKNYGAASEALKEAIEKYPKSAEAHALLGYVSWELRDKPLATKHFREAVALSPTSEMASLGLTHLLLETGEKKEAIAEVNRYCGLVQKPSQEYQDMADSVKKISQECQDVDQQPAGLPGGEPTRRKSSRVTFYGKMQEASPRKFRLSDYKYLTIQLPPNGENVACSQETIIRLAKDGTIRKRSLIGRPIDHRPGVTPVMGMTAAKNFEELKDICRD